MTYKAGDAVEVAVYRCRWIPAVVVGICYERDCSFATGYVAMSAEGKIEVDRASIRRPVKT